MTSRGGRWQVAGGCRDWSGELGGFTSEISIVERGEREREEDERVREMRGGSANGWMVSWIGWLAETEPKEQDQQPEEDLANEPKAYRFFWRNEEWRMEKLKKPNGCDSNESRQEAKRTSHHWSKRLKVGSGSILKMRESCGGVLHTERDEQTGESRSARLGKAD